MNTPLLSQLAANLISLAVALWLDWPPAMILALFWAENVVIALWQIPRLLLAGGGERPTPWPSRLFMTLFFLVHYGMFTFVHGAFVFELFLHRHMSFETLAEFFSHPGPQLAVLAMLVSHGVRFFVDLGAGRVTSALPSAVMNAPYHRIVVLHLVVLGSGFLLGYLPYPVVGLVLLTLIKSAMEIVGAIKNKSKKETSAHVPQL